MAATRETSAPTKPDPVGRIAAECLAVRMRILNRAVTAIYDQALRPVGLKVSQMNVLVLLAKRGPLRPTDAGRSLYMDKSTLSRNVERMVRRGWLQLLPGSDERTHELSVTAKGKRLIRRAFPHWEKAQRQAAELLGAAGAGAVDRMVTRLRSAEGKP